MTRQLPEAPKDLQKARREFEDARRIFETSSIGERPVKPGRGKLRLLCSPSLKPVIAWSERANGV